MRKGQPLPLQLEVKISCSQGQGISYSVPVLALSPFRPASMGPHSAHDGSTVVCSRGQTPYARVPKPRTLRSTPGTPAII